MSTRKTPRQEPTEHNAQLSSRLRARLRVLHRMRGYLNDELMSLPAEATEKERQKIRDEWAVVGLAISFIRLHPELVEEILEKRLLGRWEASEARYARSADEYH